MKTVEEMAEELDSDYYCDAGMSCLGCCSSAHETGLKEGFIKGHAKAMETQLAPIVQKDIEAWKNQLRQVHAESCEAYHNNAKAMETRDAEVRELRGFLKEMADGFHGSPYTHICSLSINEALAPHKEKKNENS